MWSKSNVFKLVAILILLLFGYPSNLQQGKCYASIKKEQQRNFTVDQNQGTFIKDGRPFRYVSGSIHYFRVPEQYWMDRLQKARFGGLNTIQTYIEWSSHQPEPDILDFSGNLNFTKYFQIAQQLGLLVIVRLGPFIASERDNMGLPYWLATKNSSMQYRTSDSTFLKYVSAWYNIMLPMLVPYLYQNGGPIIMGQVENEYGSFVQCDNVYTTWLRDLFRKNLGSEFLLFTVDGNSQRLLSSGVIENVYPTIDFGPKSNVNQSFATERLFSLNGPSVNTEYYTGWFDVWGAAHVMTSTEQLVKTLDEMLEVNASVNFYMYHGGTSFGFMNGALTMGKYFAPMVTSYDYDSPISEDGQLHPKYFAIKKVIEKYFPLPIDDPGVHITYSNNLIDKKKIDKIMRKSSLSTNNITSRKNITIKVDFLTDIFQLINQSNGSIKPIESRWPWTFEQINLRHGFIYYQHRIDFRPSDPILLNVEVLHDRALVFINGSYRTTLSRMDNINSAPLNALLPNDVLGLLVENQGHTCCSLKPERKGIIGNVTLGGRILENWQMYPIFYNWSSSIGTTMMQYTKGVEKQNKCGCDSKNFNYRPSFYVAVFNITDNEYDRYLDVRGCARKGIAFINGFNLGRYWPVMGPQITLYVPKYLLRPNNNILFLFELESDFRHCIQVQLIDRHILNGSVPDKTAIAKAHEYSYRLK